MSRGLGREHGVTRRAIAAAACEVIARDGASALSVRRVAAAAEVSPGRVQHYFPDRASMMLAAFDVVQEEVAAEVASAVNRDPDPHDMLHAILTELIPAHEAALSRLRVMAEFEALSLTDASLAERLRSGHLALSALLAQLVSAGWGVPEHESKELGRILLATAEGLGSQVLLGHTPADRAKQLLRIAIEHFQPKP